MKVRTLIRRVIILVIVMCNIGCDQISKNIAREELSYNESHTFINYFTLTKVENSGAFLSVGNSLPFAVKLFLLSIIPSIALIFGIYVLLTRKSLSKGFIIGSCFVIGGGLGNLYDRIIYGSVTDFMHIDFIIFRTGIFNMADVSIMLGIAIIFLEMQFGKPKSSQEQLTVT